MAKFTVEQQKIIEMMKTAYPKEIAGLQSEQILSLYDDKIAQMKLSEEEEISVFGIEKANSSVIKSGLTLSRETKGQNGQTAILPNDKEQAVLAKLRTKISKIEENTTKAEESNGRVRKAWSWLKNNVPFLDKITDSSNEVREQGVIEQKILDEVASGKKTLQEAFVEITGIEFTEENITKFLEDENSEIKTKSEQALNDYKEGQEMAGDTVADMVSGIAAMGAYSLAVGALVSSAPFVAVAGVGIGAAILIGGGVKVGIKYATRGDSEYTSKDLKYDLATGAFSGVLAPFTGGVGGAVGKAAATKLGLQVAKAGVENVAENAAKSGIKQTLKTALINPSGYEYGTKFLAKGEIGRQVKAYGAEMATDGVLSGFLDGGFRAGYENDWDAGAMAESSVMGGLAGGAMAPAFGLGMKGAGRGGHSLGERIRKLFGWGKSADDAVPTGTAASKGTGEANINPKQEEHIEATSAKTLEGDVKDTELEEVAPFAQHLAEEKHIGDIVVPNKENVEIENGDFINGEFVPDGSVTVYANKNNPLNKKSLTRQKTSYPSFLVAQNKKELSQQILDILGEKKINKYLSKEIDEILEKNPDLKISDLSEILGYLNNIGHARGFIQHGLSSVKDFKSFKANVKNYGEFLYQLEHAELGYQMEYIHLAKFEDYHFNDFMRFIEKIDSENFKANCNAFLNMRGYLKNRSKVNDFLTTVHDKKCLERIQILDDFNYKYTDYNSYSGEYRKMDPFTDLDFLSDDKKFAELLERMELCKKTVRYSKDDARDILHNGMKDLAQYKKFHTSVPEGLRPYIYEYYREILANAPDKADNFIEFCNKVPEGWLKAVFDTRYGNNYYREERCNIFMNYGAKCWDDRWYKKLRSDGYYHDMQYEPHIRSHEEILKRIELLKKVEHIVKYEEEGTEKFSPKKIVEVLFEYDINDIDKALVFLNTVDENYLGKIKLDGYNSNGRYYLFEYINSSNLDGMIENAKLYNTLPESFKKFQTDKGYSYDVNLNVEPDIFKARVDIIQKYADKLDNYTLDQILYGNYISEMKNYDRLFELPENVQNIVLNRNYGANSYITKLGILNDEGYKKFVKLISEVKLNDNEIRDCVSHIDYRINLWEELSFDELNAINPRVFAGGWNHADIDIMRKRISQIPDRMRPYIKYADKSCELMQYASSWFDTEYETAQRVIAAIQRLNKLSDSDLNNIGANGLNRFLDESKYHLADNAMFPKEKLEQLNRLPKGILERLQEHDSAIYNLLIEEGEIDVKTMTSRYKLLESKGLLEKGKINKGNFYALMTAGEDKFSVISEILASSTREIDNIDWLIGALPSSEVVRKHHDFIFDTLINNPNNDFNNISDQLRYVFDNRKGFSKSEAEIEASIEFGKKVVKDLIKRGDINEAEADNKNLLSNLFSAIKNYGIDTLEQEQARYASLMKNIDYKGAQKSDIVSLYRDINGLEHLNIIDDLLNKSKFSFETIVNLNKTIYRKNYSETRIKFLNKALKDDKIKEEHIVDILDVITDENVKLAERLGTDKSLNFPQEHIASILGSTNSQNIEEATRLCLNYRRLEIEPNQIPMLLNNTNNLSVHQVRKVNKVFGREAIAKMSDSDFKIAAQFIDIKDVTNINEIPAHAKKDFLKALVACNQGLFSISDDLKKMFPMIPTNRDDYCSLLPAIVRSLGIETNILKPEQTIKFNKSMGNLSESLAKISDTDFANLHITQEYSRKEFIQTTLQKLKGLSANERQKVFDYFGFELHTYSVKTDKLDPKGKPIYEKHYTITGYPVNLNNGHKLAQITNLETKSVVENLRPDIIRFSRENRIKCENPQVENLLNDLAEALPELHSIVGRVQHGSHQYDVLQHSLKVMQKISQDSNFKNLSESDKKIMLLASIMHDITKKEGTTDVMHAINGSFDTFFIAKKFNLTREEEIKLYTIIKHHEWLSYANSSYVKSEEELTRRLQSIAYDLRHDNMFDLALMFTHADLRAVKTDDAFHDSKIGKSRVNFNGEVHSFGESADIFAKRIREYITELKKSQPILPVTKMPRASRIKQAITHVNPDGSTNIKGVYQDKDGLVIIRFNEVDDWEALGLPKGTISKGIKANDGVDTGNIHFFVHGLDYVNQLAKFDAFGMVDSEVLLSLSYAERPESKFRFFRTQGVLLDIPTKYVHGGGNTDSGSGCGKFISEFKKNYIFGGHRESDRLYISNLVKEATGMSDDEYVKFVEKYENKPFTEIYPEDIRNKIIKIFAEINSRIRKNGERSYNEMYGSNPSDVMGVFGYPEDLEGKIGDNVFDFVLHNDKLNGFLRQYALERDIPMYILGY